MRRLRRRLTALFTLTSAIGLIALAALAIDNDATARQRELDASLISRVEGAVLLLNTDEKGRIDVQRLVNSMGTDCPALTVLAGAPDRLTVVHAPRRSCLNGSPAALRAVAATALRKPQSAATAEARGKGGGPVRLVALAFSGGPDRGTEGAIVGAQGTAPDDEEHRELATRLLVGCAVLISLSAVSGHLLSGRAIRPALTALHQQEAFLADAAHDLRTPAASLRALAETALRDGTQRTAALQRTLSLATRMGDLVDGLLTRARLMAGVGTVAREPLRLDQLVEVIVADTPHDAHHITVNAQPTVVTADPELLRRAVGNLLDNALCHGHVPGHPATVEMTVTADGTLTVDDAGPGVSPSLSHSLFERFHSGSGSTGLGLSIASWVAHAHNGTLTAEPSARGGARFVLKLPARGR
ncbi:two-component sensor histidine kinase [Streptomyces lydicus]|uniref:histidine kinase n=1 Tax=Streptomyces lydicus TaxID=47763 RepID=A0A3Q9KFU7_9ACTN|nr:two-component sensor histidine kinase [Streptomyces lydicus]